MTQHDAPPSHGERQLQAYLGTSERAAHFYDRQVHAYLTSAMCRFIARQSMLFLSTADSSGRCDATFRAGPPGFVTVLDEHTLTYPDYRGNGVMASAGNIVENAHVGMLFMDFTYDHIGLHVNGSAQVWSDQAMRAAHPWLPEDPAPGRRPVLWSLVTVHEAYVHCSKYIPHLEPASRVPKARAVRPKDSAYFTEPAVALPSPAPPDAVSPSR